MNHLEKKFKHGGPVTLDQTLDVAITSLQAVLSSDFKPDEVGGGKASVRRAGLCGVVWLWLWFGAVWFWCCVVWF